MLGRPATLDDITDAELDAIAARGFDWVWLLSVWQTGPAGRQIALADPGLRRAFEAELPDLARRGHRRLAASRSPATR